MADDNKTTNHIARTIALPALLVISLLVAKLVMHSKTNKTNLRLSAPINLNRSGLSVSMPSGNGWQCEEKWSFENRSFNVSSIFASGLNERSYAQCRYLLASGEETPKERLGRDYSGIKLIVTGQLTEDNLTVNWASTNTNSGVEIILGVCELSDGRQLEIEILQGASELNPAKDIFEKIVKSIRFSDNGLLRAGTRLISNIRALGLDIAAGNSNKLPASMFTIADSYNKTIGFAMDAMVLVKKEADTTINAADYYYLRGTVTNEQVGFFRGSTDLRQFVWRVEMSSRTRKKGIEMTADSGKLTIRRLRTGSPFDKRTGSDTGECELGETAVPDIVLEPILTNALDSNEQAFIIDIITSEGDVIPVYLEKSPPPNGQTDSNSIRLEWLDGRSYWQQNYYDDSGNPTKKVLKQESTYTFNRTDANEIATIFPERADLVNGKKHLLDGDGF
jgi:hypothetical protein